MGEWCLISAWTCIFFFSFKTVFILWTISFHLSWRLKRYLFIPPPSLLLMLFSVFRKKFKWYKEIFLSVYLVKIKMLHRSCLVFIPLFFSPEIFNWIVQSTVLVKVTGPGPEFSVCHVLLKRGRVQEVLLLTLLVCLWCTETCFGMCCMVSAWTVYFQV